MIVFHLSEQVHLSEREKQKLQVWSRIMPYKESFAWTIVPLFDNSIAATSGGAASPSSPLAPSVSGSSSHDGVFEPVAKITLDGKLGYSSGSSVVVEISNLNKVKESYTEDSLQVRWRSDSFISISFTIFTIFVCVYIYIYFFFSKLFMNTQASSRYIYFICLFLFIFCIQLPMIVLSMYNVLHL
jgi:hypothetical protein